MANSAQTRKRTKRRKSLNQGAWNTTKAEALHARNKRLIEAGETFRAQKVPTGTRHNDGGRFQ